MNHPAAEQLALRLVEQMRPYVRRIEIAGSIRRQCAEVRDLEIVAVPLWEPRLAEDAPEDAVPVETNTLFEWAMSDPRPVRWIKTGTPPEVIVDWDIKPDGKYWRAIAGNGIHLDLFLPDLDNWGWIYAVRTGSRDFSHALAARANAMGLTSHKGYLRRGDKDGPKLITREEADVFRLLSLEYTAPKDRVDGTSLRPLRAAPPEPPRSTGPTSREVYQLARRAGYPNGLVKYRGVIVQGDCLWGYACMSASPRALVEIERTLREYLASGQLPAERELPVAA